MERMFRFAKLSKETPCNGGHETLGIGTDVVYVLGMNALLRDEVSEAPYCGYDHIRSHAHRRGNEISEAAKSVMDSPLQTERARRLQRAWDDLEKAADRADFGKTRGTR